MNLVVLVVAGLIVEIVALGLLNRAARATTRTTAPAGTTAKIPTPQSAAAPVAPQAPAPSAGASPPPSASSITKALGSATQAPARQSSVTEASRWIGAAAPVDGPWQESSTGTGEFNFAAYNARIAREQGIDPDVDARLAASEGG
jgi:hypothetical protein